MNLAAAEHRIPGETLQAANLSSEMVEFLNTELPPCPEDIHQALDESLVEFNNLIKHKTWTRNHVTNTISNTGISILEDYQKKPWIDVIFVDEVIYLAIQDLRARNNALDHAFSKVVCAFYRDNVGNYV